jgi:hypothetical protein
MAVIIDVRIDVRTSSRPQILKHLTEFSAQPGDTDPKQRESVIHETWLNYARLERPKRLLRMLLHLIEDSAHERLSSYKAMEKEAGTDSYHECMHLIKLLGELCRANNWPPYPVLIKQESSGKVGSGFFSDYGIEGSALLKEKFEEAHTVECFERTPPTAFEICTRLLEFIDKKNLGKI